MTEATDHSDGQIFNSAIARTSAQETDLIAQILNLKEARKNRGMTIEVKMLENHERID